MVPGHQHAAVTPRLLRKMRAATPRRGLRRLAGRVACPHCSNTGSIWVICPDAGAIKLPCECGGPLDKQRHVDLADFSLGAAFLACCGLVYFLI